MSQKTDCEKLKELLFGYTIIDIVSVGKREGMFKIVVTNEKTIREVEIFGTELGWWIGSVHQRQKKKVIKTSVVNAYTEEQRKNWVKKDKQNV